MKEPKTLLDLAASETKFLQDVANLTDRNDHNGALLLIANYTGYKASAKIIQAICQIHDVEQHMPSALIDYRSEVRNRLLTDIKRNNPELFTKIQKAL